MDVVDTYDEDVLAVGRLESGVLHEELLSSLQLFSNVNIISAYMTCDLVSSVTVKQVCVCVCVHEGKLVYMGCSDVTKFVSVSGSRVVEQVYMSCNCGLPDNDTLVKMSLGVDSVLTRFQKLSRQIIYIPAK